MQVNQQIETNHSMQDKLHGDLEHKDMALEIDRDCHEMHNDAIDIKVFIKKGKKTKKTTSSSVCVLCSHGNVSCPDMYCNYTPLYIK